MGRYGFGPLRKELSKFDQLNNSPVHHIVQPCYTTVPELIQEIQKNRPGSNLKVNNFCSY
jgi:hypothetical protein